MRCRTKAGELRLYYEGQDYLLDCAGLDLPDDLARDIRTHVNVIVDDGEPSKQEPDSEQGAADDPETEESGDVETPEAEGDGKRSRRSRRDSG